MAGKSEPMTAEQFQAAARHAGIDLQEAELDDLRYGYDHLLKWINALRGGWTFDDESAHRFVPPEDTT